MATLQALTLAELTCRRLRDRVVRGELLAGPRLMPEDVGQDLSISPIPVKEALLKLARDGLIVSTARRGSVVRRFSTRDIAELYEARLMIEQRAISVGVATGRWMTRCCRVSPPASPCMPDAATSGPPRTCARPGGTTMICACCL